jgi:GNAT superfamily N-acetyltransferase
MLGACEQILPADAWMTQDVLPMVDPHRASSQTPGPPDVRRAPCSWSLYLLRPWRGQGNGRRLMAEIARRLVGAGYGGLIVWTQPENRPARAFYERLGGVYVRTRPSGVFQSVGYGWRDIRALL